MNLFKKIFHTIDAAIRGNALLIEYVLCGFLLLGLLTQIASFASILQSRADHRSIVATVDNDSNWGIETAERTNLLNDNQRRSYGPVWYRVNYLMRLWADNPILDTSRNDQQNKEKDIYFTLMLLNLICVYLLAAGLAYVFFSRLKYQLMATLFLGPALLNQHFQALLVILAKPDHLLCLLTVVSFVLTAYLFKTNFEERATKWAAFFWGATLSTKLTALPFIPVILLILYLSNRTEWQPKAKAFVKALAISYLLIGFPQNFDFWRNLAYIRNQNSQTSWGNWHSLVEWLKVYGEQIARPAALLSLFVVIFETRPVLRDYFKKDLAWKLLALFGIPAAFMLSRKIDEPYFRWYTLPFVATGLVLVGAGMAFLVSRFATLLEKKAIASWKERLLQHPYSFLVLFFLLPWTLPLNSTTLSSVQKEFEVCRAEAKQTESYIDRAVANKEHILADPYAPFTPAYENVWLQTAWEMNTNLIVTNKTKWIVLKNNYYATYLTKAEGGTEGKNANLKDPEGVRNFYRLFWKKEVTQDTHGQTWKKVYSDACGFEVWHQEL